MMRGVLLGEKPDDGRDDSGSSKRDVTSVALQVLAAFGTGIGILGFVVFFGAAILWIRYDRVGLPATEAVAVVPKPTLLTTGAVFLAPALGVALLSVLLLPVINLGLGLEKLGTTPGAKPVNGATGNVNAVINDDRAFLTDLYLSAFFISVVLLIELRVIGKSALQIGFGQTLIIVATFAAFAVVIALTDWGINKTHYSALRAPVGAVLGLTALVTLWRLAHALGSFDELGSTFSLLVLALITAIISWLVYRQTKRLVLLGIATFLSVGIFAGHRSTPAPSTGPRSKA